MDNNLNRADAVLAKANQDDIDGLDLLVLPELAFSGMVCSRMYFICANARLLYPARVAHNGSFRKQGEALSYIQFSIS